MASGRMVGIDFHSWDGQVIPPTKHELEPFELFKWFQSFDNIDNVPIRILAIRIDWPSDLQKYIEDVIPAEVIEHAIWRPEVYTNLTKDAAGGAAGLIDDPFRFILQTPLDGSPFCSLAMSRRGILAKGIYFYNNDAFDPLTLTGCEKCNSGWRSSGLQIATLPQMFLQADTGFVSQRLARCIAHVKAVEIELSNVDQTWADFGAMGRTLHQCSMELVDLERRSRFEDNLVIAIETIVGASRQHGRLPWSPIAPQKAAMASRSFDFESLPRRIQNARAMINGLIQQRNAQLNLELTQASHQIAEATLKDSKSMKAIAIMTMVLLPGTAVASFFSMDIFDWSAESGSQIASKWLWVYFVVAVPVTATVLIIWWFWSKQKRRGVARQIGLSRENTGARFEDIERQVIAGDLDKDNGIIYKND